MQMRNPQVGSPNHVWDVSTWQGKCMNLPVGAQRPRAEGDSMDYYFDFEIVDTSRYKYDIYTINREIPLFQDFNSVDEANNYLQRALHGNITVQDTIPKFRSLRG